MKKNKGNFMSVETANEFIDLIGEDIDSLTSDTIVEGSLESNLIQYSRYGEQYDNRDVLYTELLEHYIDTTKLKNRSNKLYKRVFFWFVVCAFAILVLTPVVVTFIVLFGKLTDTSAVMALAGGAVSAIPAVIVLPKIIAQHLFPTDEDKNMIDLVKSMQENDSGIRTNSKKED